MGGPERELAHYLLYKYAPDWYLNFYEKCESGYYFGTFLGEESAMSYADKYETTGNPLYYVGGLFASLWTPDTYMATASTLAAGYGAGEALAARGASAAAKDIGYHATSSEAADSIMQSGFKAGTKPGRLGSNGTYVNSTPEGAAAELKFHNPGVEPKVIEVKYNKGVNASTSTPPNNYVNNHPLNADSVSAPSVRAPGTTNTNIVNGTARPVRILP